MYLCICAFVRVHVYSLVPSPNPPLRRPLLAVQVPKTRPSSAPFVGPCPGSLCLGLRVCPWPLGPLAFHGWSRTGKEVMKVVVLSGGLETLIKVEGKRFLLGWQSK